MNFNRLLNRRERDGGSHNRQKSRDKSSDKKARPVSSDGITSLFEAEAQRKRNKEQDVKIQTIKHRLHDQGYLDIGDNQISYALLSKHADGNVDRALEMVLLFQESVEGVIKPYDPTIHMRGAENRQGVTCYLDTLLFAMFARLGSFEPILYTKFEDEPRRRLSTLIRLWVNMLRTGKLIQTDITGHLQVALAACGWDDAAKLVQQDTSEAFSFITEKLELPLLTLKMDIYHTGTEDDRDDHKFIHERLLEVAVPPDPGNGRPIQLEDCLESFFNNRVEVVRRLERSNTLSSIQSGCSPSAEKSDTQHVEIAEIPWPAHDSPTTPQNPGTPLTPTISRTRASSIIRHRLVLKDENAWYTQNSPANDAEVVAHFSQTRPVLGICLKRYAVSENGQATRENTFIDIPLDIRLPHFIEDDSRPEKGPLMGNFKLSLQSVICHRGNSLHSGHYVSFIRAAPEVADGDSASARRLSTSSRPPHYPVDHWVRHDDLSQPERVQYVDIEQALRDEMPYLLFYQVQPTSTYDVSPTFKTDYYPPSYDSGIDIKVLEPNLLPNGKSEAGNSGNVTGQSTPAYRLSSEVEMPRRSINLPEDWRDNLEFTNSTMKSTAINIPLPEVPSTPATPIEETTAQRLSRAASRFAKSGSRSRPVSSSGESRISATFSRMTARSKEQLNKTDSKLEPTKELPTTTATITTIDGAFEACGTTAAEVEERQVKQREITPDRARVKLGRKRDKNKEIVEIPLKGKGKEDPERECIVM